MPPKTAAGAGTGVAGAARVPGAAGAARVKAPKASGPAGRTYSPRKPQAPEFHRSWNFIGDVSTWDKIEGLARCEPSKFGHENLLCFSQVPDALDAMIWMATGWQPGHELVERMREDFWKAMARQHAHRGYPLHKHTPESCVTAAEEAFGKAEELGFTLDVCRQTGQQLISDGQFTHRLPVSPKGWQLVAPEPGQPKEKTVITNGSEHYFAASLFTHFKQAALSCLGDRPGMTMGWGGLSAAATSSSGRGDLSGANMFPLMLAQQQAQQPQQLLQQQQQQQQQVMWQQPPQLMQAPGMQGQQLLQQVSPYTQLAGPCQQVVPFEQRRELLPMPGPVQSQSPAPLAVAAPMPRPSKRAMPLRDVEPINEDPEDCSDDEEREVLQRLASIRAGKRQRRAEAASRMESAADAPPADIVAAQEARMKEMQQELEALRKQVADQNTGGRRELLPAQSSGERRELLFKARPSKKASVPPLPKAGQLDLAGVLRHKARGGPSETAWSKAASLAAPTGCNQPNLMAGMFTDLLALAPVDETSTAGSTAGGTGDERDGEEARASLPSPVLDPLSGAAEVPLTDAEAEENPALFSVQQIEDGSQFLMEEHSGKWRRLSRAESGGCDDWTLYTDPVSGMQIVASQSGFGPRFEAAAMLMPPPSEVAEGHELDHLRSEFAVKAPGADQHTDDDHTDEEEP